MKRIFMVSVLLIALLPVPVFSAEEKAGVQLSEKVDSDLIPFLGKWVGQWQWDRGSYDIALTFKTDETNKPVVHWHSGPRGTGRNKQGATDSERHPKLVKKGETVYAVFKNQDGTEIELHIENGKLIGGNTSSNWNSKCSLEKVSQ